MTNQELELIKEEYRRLSQEIGGTLTHRHQIIQFGLVFVGVLVTFALESNDPVSAPVILTIMIPAACFMVLSLWLSELTRTRRASWYLYGLERRVNNELKYRALRWEEDIRKQGLFTFHYYTTTHFFVIVAVLATAYGTWQWIVIPAIIRVVWLFLFVVLTTFIIRVILRRLQKYDIPDKSWPEEIPDKPLKAHRKFKRLA